MEEIGASFYIRDLDGQISPKEITTDFIYVKLHGPKKTYKGQYDTKILSGWGVSFTAWSTKAGKYSVILIMTKQVMPFRMPQDYRRCSNIKIKKYLSPQ